MRNPLLLLPLLGIAGCAVSRAEAPAGALLVDQIHRTGRPVDWFEVFNKSDQEIELADYVFVDHQGDLDRAVSFPDITLAPGESYVQRVTRAEHGFQIGRRERIWIYPAE